MNYTLLKELLTKIKDFEESGAAAPSSDVNDFRIWLNREYFQQHSAQNLYKKENITETSVDNDLCKQLLLISRYSKSIIRKGTESLPGLANEDFTYLFRLIDENEMCKTELIEKNAHEKQTGLEVIRRLMKQGYVAEKTDTRDARRKIIYPTEAGRLLFEKAAPVIYRTSANLAGNLTMEEKENLLQLLKKLNLFHESFQKDYQGK